MCKATFAAGCFWGVEAEFRKIKGVISTTTGYMGGTLRNPSYEDVCSNKSGHAEVVQILYDPKQITYNKLLDIFWNIHDPTQLNRQGVDIGKQYRSVIFYHTEKQRKQAEESKQQLQKTQKFKKEIVTNITKATIFYPAEDYHQQYYKKVRLSE